MGFFFCSTVEVGSATQNLAWVDLFFRSADFVPALSLYLNLLFVCAFDMTIKEKKCSELEGLSQSWYQSNLVDVMSFRPTKFTEQSVAFCS